jgi:hypothetical protein
VPFEPSHMLFTVVFILIGVGFVGSALGVLLGEMLDKEEALVARTIWHDDEEEDNHEGSPAPPDFFVDDDELLDGSNTVTNSPGGTRRDSRNYSTESVGNGAEGGRGGGGGGGGGGGAVSSARNRLQRALRRDVAYNRQLHHLFFSIMNMVLIIAVGTVGFMTLEDRAWYESLYFAVVSVTTVGYGDEICTRTVTKCFAIVYLVVAVAFFTAALQAIAAFPLETRRRKNELRVLQQYGDAISFDDLMELTQTASRMFDDRSGLTPEPPERQRQQQQQQQKQKQQQPQQQAAAAAADLSRASSAGHAAGAGIKGMVGDSGGAGLFECTKEQFALAMLLKLKKISMDDIKACMRQFKQLDKDSSGILDAMDVLLAREAHAAKRKRKQNKQKQQQQQQLRDAATSPGT